MIKHNVYKCSWGHCPNNIIKQFHHKILIEITNYIIPAQLKCEISIIIKSIKISARRICWNQVPISHHTGISILLNTCNMLQMWFFLVIRGCKVGEQGLFLTCVKQMFYLRYSFLLNIVHTVHSVWTLTLVQCIYKSIIYRSSYKFQWP